MREIPSIPSILEGTDPSTINANGIRPIFVLSGYDMEVAMREFKTDKFRFQMYNKMLGWEWDESMLWEKLAKGMVPKITVEIAKAKEGSYYKYLLQSVVWELGLVTCEWALPEHLKKR